MLDYFEFFSFSNPVFVAGIIVPVTIALALIFLRFKVSKQYQSPVDFIIVPIAIDIVYLTYPDLFPFISHLVNEVGLGKLPIYTLLFTSVSVVLIIVLAFEHGISRAEKIPLAGAWGMAIGTYFPHFSFVVAN